MSHQRYTHTRRPHDIAAGVRRRIKQLASAREMLALEVISDDFVPGFSLAMEHLQFLQADLQAELDLFRAKYNLEEDTK